MSLHPEEIEHYPGYFIRRLQQMAVARFMEETQAHGVTPVQYAALSAVQRHPGMDQRTLAQSIHFDTSTIGSVIDRLEARGWLVRGASATDRRVRLLTLTPEGERLLEAVEPAVQRAQQRMLDPLPERQRQQFLRTMATLVRACDAPAQDGTPVAAGTTRTRRRAR
ncbi:MAG: MarR family transcriptional regulator [Comamonadaceae bacterium]|nr:MarR family transcriptional regulator [Comamonadaceae bacterium]